MANTIKSLSKKLENNEVKPSEILQSYVNTIEKHDSKVGAFVSLEKEQAQEWAKEADERQANSKRLGALDGVPIGIKDNIVIEDLPSSCASKLLENYKSSFSATVINKLQGEGMIPMSRLNMDEFAMGSSTENSAFLKTKNPHNLDFTPGGSSGGSAAAVAAQFVPVALGSDTGGSIRQPASFCGVVGLKPTYGTVSRYGLVAFASSLDQIGPLATSVDDAQLVYEAIKGNDKFDSTTIPQDKIQVPSFSSDKIKIGIPRKLIEGSSTEVMTSFENSIEALKEQYGNDAIIDIELPNQKYAVPVYYITASCEASTNLARFDGIRYGTRAHDVKNLVDVYENSRTQGFGEEVQRRILVGTFALSSGYYDAFYSKAQKVRRLIQQDYFKAFESVNCILMPTSPTLPFKIGEKTDDIISMYLSDVMTVGASLAGIPALSLPSPSEGLPIGMQLQGPFFSESTLFEVGRVMEKHNPVKLPTL